MYTYKKILALLRNRFVKNSASIFISSLISKLLGFVSVFIIINYLSAESFGYFSIGILAANAVPQLADFGLSTTFIRFGSYLKTQSVEQKRFLLKKLFKIRILSILFFVPLGLVLSYGLEIIYNKKELALFLMLGLLISIPIVIRNYLQTIWKINESFVRLSIFQITGNACFLIATVFLYIFDRISAIWAIVAFGAAPSSVILFNLTYIRNEWSGKIDKLNLNINKNIIFFSKWLTFSTIIVFLNEQLDAIMIAYYIGVDGVGIYFAARKFIDPVLLLSVSISTVYLPQVSQFKDISEFKKNSTKIIILSSIFLLIALVSIMISESIFSIFDREYALSADVFRILAFLPFFKFCNQISGIFLIVLNNVNSITKINLIQLSSNFIFNILLIPYYGVRGAAYATLAASLVGTFCLYLTLQKTITNYKNNLIFFIKED